MGWLECFIEITLLVLLLMKHIFSAKHVLKHNLHDFFKALTLL